MSQWALAAGGVFIDTASQRHHAPAGLLLACRSVLCFRPANSALRGGAQVEPSCLSNRVLDEPIGVGPSIAERVQFHGNGLRV